MKKIILGFSLLLSTVAFSAPNIFQATTEKVKVFNAGALLHQNSKLTLPAGASEIIIRNVAQDIQLASLQMKLPEGVTIINVDFRKWQPTSTELSNVKNVIQTEWLNEKEHLKSLQLSLKTIKSSLSFLNKLEQPANFNNSQFDQYLEHYAHKTKALLKQEQDLIEKIQDQEIIIQRLENNHPTLSNINAQGEIVLKVNSSRPINSSIELTYFTPLASWAPEYDLSLQEYNQSMSIHFNALLYQNTGINWEEVSLIFSTGRPASFVHLPNLNPWFLNFTNPQLERQAIAYAADMNVANMASKERNINESAPMITFEEGSMNNEYVVGGKVDVMSAPSSQTIAITQENIATRYEYVLMPQMAQQVYLVALVYSEKNNELLPGTANILKDRQYLGQTYFNPHQLKDTIQLGVGVEERIIVQRTKLKDFLTSRAMGNKQTQQYEYKISLENLKSEAVTVKVEERIPLSGDKNIEIDWKEHPQNKYKGVLNPEKGIITWNVELPASSKVELIYELDIHYPKDRAIPKIY